MRGILVSLSFVIITLAGCTDAPDSADGTVEGAINEEEFVLEVGKGAIEGLLVDDRFRPIDLEDDPQTEFQTTGFVLLQQTGQQVQTDENGQFAFVDLEPGSYTLRVTAGGHEAIPARVTVEEGLFADAQLLARRVSSAGSTIITNEYAVFIPCAADYLANGGNLPCDLDLSDDSYSSAYSSDLTALTDFTFLVTELRANQESGYHVQLRGAEQYAVAIWEGDYVKIVHEKDQINEEWTDAAYPANEPFTNTDTFDTIFFVEHATLRQALPVGCCGVGFTMGVKGQFLQSVFLGAPDVDIETYCGLC